MIARMAYLCPVCDGEADDRLCYCDGRGMIDAESAAGWIADGFALRPVPTPPERMESPCHDCAFRRGSPEREDGTYSALLGLARIGMPFYCHQGMHETSDGRYIPLEQRGEMPVGHPVCAGWQAARDRHLRKA